MGDGTQHPVLGLGRQVPVEGKDGHLTQVPQALRGGPDLAASGQERQDVPRVCRQDPADRIGHEVRDPAGQLARQMGDLDRERPSPAGEDGRAAEDPRHGPRVQGRRCHQQPQVLAQTRPDVEGEGQGEVQEEAPLVGLVQHHQAHALEGGVALQAPEQDALREHLHAGPRRDPLVEAHPVADRLADRLAQDLRHTARRRPRGQAPGLGDEDRPAREPGLAEQGEGHERGLARARRRRQHRAAPERQRPGELGQDLAHGQVREGRGARGGVQGHGAQGSWVGVSGQGPGARGPAPGARRDSARVARRAKARRRLAARDGAL